MHGYSGALGVFASKKLANKFINQIKLKDEQYYNDNKLRGYIRPQYFCEMFTLEDQMMYEGIPPLRIPQ
jgi:hypothetical protein